MFPLPRRWKFLNTPGSGRPLVIFAPRFVVVKALGYVGSDSWILGVCDRRAVRFLFFCPRRSPERGGHAAPSRQSLLVGRY